MLMLASRSVDPLAQHVVSLKEKVVTNGECGHLLVFHMTPLNLKN